MLIKAINYNNCIRISQSNNIQYSWFLKYNTDIKILLEVSYEQLNNNNHTLIHL